LKLFRALRAGLAKKAQANLSLAIYSVLIAILAWFVISMTFYPSVPKTIKNVELSLDISGSSAAENGFSIIDCNVKYVNVRIKGSRTQVGNIDSNSLSAYLDAENVRTTGTKTLNIKVKSENGDNIELVSVYPETATVEIDKVETREFHVVPDFPNITYAEGKALYEAECTCEPNTVEITGPSATLDKIAVCKAVTTQSKKLDSSLSTGCDELQLITEDGIRIDTDPNTSKLKFSQSESKFRINISVVTQKSVDITVSLANCPQQFDADWFLSKLKFSNDIKKITIASKNSTNIPESLTIGQVNLCDVDIDPPYTQSCNINAALNKGNIQGNMINISGLDEVTVSLDGTGLKKKAFTITLKYDKNNSNKNNVDIINDTDNTIEYDVETKQLSFYAIGPEEVIDGLDSGNFVATVDFLNQTVQELGSYDVIISYRRSDKVWATTTEKVWVKRVPKQATTTSSDDSSD